MEEGQIRTYWARGVLCREDMREGVEYIQRWGEGGGIYMQEGDMRQRTMKERDAYVGRGMEWGQKCEYIEKG